MQPATWARKVIGVENRTTLEDLAHVMHVDRARRAVNAHFDAGGHDRVLLGAASQSYAHVRVFLGVPFSPAEAVGRHVECRADAVVLQMRQAVLQWINSGQLSEFIDKTLPCEVVRGGSQYAIGPLSQR